MIEPNLWKVTEILQQLLDRIEMLEESRDMNNNTFNAYSSWMEAVNNSILSLVREIEFLKHKKTPI